MYGFEKAAAGLLCLIVRLDFMLWFAELFKKLLSYDIIAMYICVCFYEYFITSWRKSEHSGRLDEVVKSLGLLSNSNFCLAMQHCSEEFSFVLKESTRREGSWPRRKNCLHSRDCLVLRRF